MNVHEKIKAAILEYVTHEFQYPSPRILSRSHAQFAAMSKLIVASDDTGHITTSVVHDLVSQIFPVPPSPASGAHQAAEIERIANSLCEAFRELPQQYKIVLSVPGIKVTHGFSFTVSEEISCCAAASSVDSQSEEASEGGQTGLTVEIGLRGYFGRYERDALLDRAWSKVRQIVYFLAPGAVNMRSEGFPQGRASARLVNALGQEYLLSMPHGLVEHVGLLKYDGDLKIIGQEDLGSQLLRVLTYARSFYAKGRDADRGHERLAAAMEWLVDSVSLSNQTMAYLAACIGLESLLGEDEGDTPTARLQDRYAYTLGRTRTERKSLANDMHEVFTRRGKLIHARASRLEGRDAASLFKIRRMLSNCLSAELSSYLGATP